MIKSLILDIQNVAKQALKFAQGFGKNTLANNKEKQFAVLYQIIVLGEVVNTFQMNFALKILKFPGNILQA